MSAQRRVTLRTAWVDESEKDPKGGSGRGINTGPNCPSCGVPLKKTRSGAMYCWFCEKEYDIDPSQFSMNNEEKPKDEPQWGKPASEAADDNVYSPDGKKQEEEMDFEIDTNGGEEEVQGSEEEFDLEMEEEGEEFDIDEEEEEEFIEEDEGEEEEDIEMDMDEEEEEEFIEEEEEEEEIEGAHLIQDEEEEEEFDIDEEEEEEFIEEDEREEEEEEEDEEDVFDPLRYRKKNRPEELEDVDLEEEEEDFEVELDDD